MGDDRELDPEHWVERHGDYLFRFALLRVREADRAADLVQETFVEALRARGSFTGRSSERTWLVAILKHKVIDRIRKHARETARSGGDAGEMDDSGDFTPAGHWTKWPAAWPKDPAAALERREFWEALHRCLSSLPAQLAEPFVLRELDGLSGEEICKLLDITPTNLWVRLHRARLALRRCLEDGWAGDGPRSRS
jgi:RNA polymerase sigma-70 factor, ECF subfamily